MDDLTEKNRIGNGFHKIEIFGIHVEQELTVTIPIKSRKTIPK